jgi:hypothetical protein
MLASARDVFDSIEEDNYRINHAPRGAEGPAGNFSNVCRRSLRQLAQLLQDEHLDLVQLGVPQRVLDVLSPRSLLTLAVENFFTQMRARWPNPYSLQYQSNHARACLLHSFQSCGASGFAYFTGTQVRPSLHRCQVFIRPNSIPIIQAQATIGPHSERRAQPDGVEETRRSVLRTVAGAVP